MSQDKLKIIYAGVRNENYDVRRRSSFEYVNFYLTLRDMKDVELIEYPFDRIVSIGKANFNKELLELVRKEKPDAIFVFMFSDELDKRTLLEIKKLTKSIAWFADDSWRFYNYSRQWAPYFTRLVTTYSWIPGLYEKIGHKNIIRSQWGANTQSWYPAGGEASTSRGEAGEAREGRPLEAKKDIDVSFVGQRNPQRAEVVERLRAAGINVFVRGWGWPEGKASQKDFLDIISRSKINLNINSQPSLFDPRSLGRLFFRRSGARIVPDFHLLDNFRSWRHIGVPQVKARPFELAACRAFVISGFADDIDKFYAEGKEMEFYRSTHELIRKIKYFLPKDAEREKIAEAAYARTLREHTYEKRFQVIFGAIGLGF